MSVIITEDGNVPNKTTPVGADRTYISNSENTPNTLAEVELSNLYKALGSGTQDSTTFLRGDGTYATPAGGGGGFNQGFMTNGKLAVTVTSNNLTVALKTLADADPSVGDPVQIRIGNVIRDITAALSVTKNAGTNWCNSGGTELAAQEVDYFAYIGYNATDGITLGFSRIPYASLYSDFSATTTNEKYAAISTITNAAAGDNYVNIGRFAATLSGGAGYTWSVPTFTSANLKQRPTYETRLLNWLPSWTNLTLGNGTQVATYKFLDTQCHFNINLVWGNTTSIAGDVSHSTPIAGVGFGNSKVIGTLGFRDTGTAQYSGVNLMQSASLINYRAIGAGGTYATQVAISSTIPFTWTTNDDFHEQGFYNMV